MFVCTRCLSPAVEICYMLNVCVYPLSQPSSRDVLYVKCLCVPVVSAQQSRCVIDVRVMCYMLNVCVYPLSQPSSRDVLYVKCLCVPVVSAQQ